MLGVNLKKIVLGMIISIFNLLSTYLCVLWIIYVSKINYTYIVSIKISTNKTRLKLNSLKY